MTPPCTCIKIEADEIRVPRKEVLRYMGFRGDDPPQQLVSMIDDCEKEFRSLATCRACLNTAHVVVSRDVADFGAFALKSRSLCKSLNGCSAAVIFAATIGSGFDRFISKAFVGSGTRGLVADAFGTAAIEAVCDRICDDVQKSFSSKGLYLRPRVSPGYGDIPIEAQMPLLDFLQSAKYCSISLTGSLMMVPTKSVSAIAGLSQLPCPHTGSSCSRCDRRENCPFRSQED